MRCRVRRMNNTVYVAEGVVTCGTISVPSYGKKTSTHATRPPERKRRTNIPDRARTVSLLASFAFNSPRSPVPLRGVAKCIVNAALDPPAETAHRARNDELKHNEAARKPEVVCADVGLMNGTEGRNTDMESTTGENTSKAIAASLRTSARRRYVFASG
jgi:hypothetical protein